MPFPEASTVRTVSAPKPRPQIMAILNVTPDSFSDGGLFLEPARAVEHARSLIAEGADMLDIGAESSRPGHTPISVEVELRRLIPVLEALSAAFDGRVPVPVSVDTTKAPVAEAAVARGVTIVNDIWGFQGDAGMAGVVARTGARAVLMHNRSTVERDIDILDDIRRFFERSLVIATRAGVPHDRLILDPGIGFGKTQAQQLTVLANLRGLRETFGLPMLLGASRKSFLKPLVGDGAPGRLIGTLAAHLAAAESGADILRVHDVEQHVAALQVASALAAARL